MEQVHSQVLAHLQSELKSTCRAGLPVDELAGPGPKQSLVTPRDGENLLDESRAKLRRQVDAITDARFIPTGGQPPAWYSQHDAEVVLSSDDAPGKLLELVRPDITAVVKSGILRYDVTHPLPRSMRRKKRA